jgi:hypothetical protein
MDDGRVLATGTPAELLARTGSDTWSRPSSPAAGRKSAAGPSAGGDSAAARPDGEAIAIEARA